MGERKINRVGTAASLKARTKQQEDHILLARGLTARLTGFNTPLAPLTSEEMERDLRHMEAFSNACTSYAQQYYIFTNQNNKKSRRKMGTDTTVCNQRQEIKDEPDSWVVHTVVTKCL